MLVLGATVHDIHTYMTYIHVYMFSANVSGITCTGVCTVVKKCVIREYRCVQHKVHTCTTGYVCTVHYHLPPGTGCTVPGTAAQY